MSWLTTRRRTLLRWLLGGVLVGALVVGVDFNGLLDRLARADPWLAAIGVTGLTAVHLLGAATWRELVGRLGGVVLPWRRSVATYYAAQALGSITPANLGGDAYRIHALGGGGHAPTVAIWPVVVQRVTSYAALSALAALALLQLAALGKTPVVIVLIGAGGSVLLGLVVVALYARGARRAHPPGTHRRVAAAFTSGLLLGLVFHGLSTLLTYLLVLSVAPEASPLPVLAAIAVARLSIVVPLTPSGLGVQEGVLSVLFVGLGLAPAAALAALLLGRVALVLTGIVGAAAIVSAPTGRSAPRAAGGGLQA